MKEETISEISTECSRKKMRLDSVELQSYPYELVRYNHVILQIISQWLNQLLCLFSSPYYSKALKDKNPSCYKFLIVDDNPINQKILQRHLRILDYSYEKADNGLDAVKKFITNTAFSSVKYDFVLMDMEMPIMDGCEATCLIRQLSLDIPIIAVTSNASEEMKQRAFDSGVCDYLLKPYKFDQLKEIIVKHRIN